MKGKLYIVATPIGNLSDMSNRAIEILKEVDLIAAEDTRTSKVLLDYFDIKTRMISNHKFNENNKVASFIDYLSEGKSMAVISDAGTPCISDPGYILVNEAIKNDIEVIGIPGSSAVITAVSISGFEALSFSFYGFLPKDKKDIIKLLKKIKNDYSKIWVFYESPRRIIKTLEIIEEEFKDCNICLCNDLTKKFEKIYRGSTKEVINMLKLNDKSCLGEYTLIIEKKNVVEERKDEISKEALIVDYIIKNKSSIKEAIRDLSMDYNKNELYKAALNLKEWNYETK